jgi:hypothetical protein
MMITSHDMVKSRGKGDPPTHSCLILRNEIPIDGILFGSGRNLSDALFLVKEFGRQLSHDSPATRRYPSKCNVSICSQLSVFALWWKGSFNPTIL